MTAKQLSRRKFLEGLTIGAAGLLGAHATRVQAEPPPETRTLRLVHIPSTCVAPQLIAEELFSAEGFSDVRYLGSPRDPAAAGPLLVAGEFDIAVAFLPTTIARIDRGGVDTILAGSHVGCSELRVARHIRSIRDLKGKRIAITGKGDVEHLYTSLFVASVGLDPDRDINWVEHPWGESVRLFSQGKIDAFFAGPPESLALRAKNVGHVLVDNGVDRPWSQYFCCAVSGHREFVRSKPIATKRALRALLKATTLCSLEPERVARFMVDKGYTAPEMHDYALQSLKELPYGKWREYNPEDSVRFYALRLHELGLIKSNPQKILSKATDWRFLNELKQELKG